MYLICGEALFDIFFENENTSRAINFEAHPGGSPYNVAIGIARLGGHSALLTGMSNDMLGERLCGNLEKESVSIKYLIRSGHRTTLSMVGVDDLGQPEYVFYGLGSADCSVTAGDLPTIEADISGYHFGSYSLVVNPVAEAFSILLEQAGDSFISVDPNVRLNVEPDIEIWRARVKEYAARADLLKISTEDIAALYPNSPPAAMAEEWLRAGVKLVVITDGSKKVSAWTENGYVVFVTPPITDVVDTVGAGDSFQAALLSKIYEDGNGDPRSAIQNLNSNSLESLLEFAISAARITCGRRGADLPQKSDIKTELS